MQQDQKINQVKQLYADIITRELRWWDTMPLTLQAMLTALNEGNLLEEANKNGGRVAVTEHYSVPHYPTDHVRFQKAIATIHEIIPYKEEYYEGHLALLEELCFPDQDETRGELHRKNYQTLKEAGLTKYYYYFCHHRHGDIISIDRIQNDKYVIIGFKSDTPDGEQIMYREMISRTGRRWLSFEEAIIDSVFKSHNAAVMALYKDNSIKDSV